MLGMPEIWDLEERRRDLLREVEHDRLCARARAARRAERGVGRRGLFWLGCRLSAWGRSLEERYGPAAAPARPDAAQV